MHEILYRNQTMTHLLTILLQENYSVERERILWIGNTFTEIALPYVQLRGPVDVIITNGSIAETPQICELLSQFNRSRYEIIIFQQPPFHVTMKNGELHGIYSGGDTYDTLKKDWREYLSLLKRLANKLVVVSSLPSEFGCKRSYADEKGTLEAWNTLLRELAGDLQCEFYDLHAHISTAQVVTSRTEASIANAIKIYSKLIADIKKYCSWKSGMWWDYHFKWAYTIHKRQWKRRRSMLLSRSETVPLNIRYRGELDSVTLMRPHKGNDASPSMLMIGDSVFRYLRTHLSAIIPTPIDLFSTTLQPPDPAYERLLLNFINDQSYEIILFSFGCHMVDRFFPVSYDEYERGYRRVADMLQSRCESLIVASSPSLVMSADLSAIDERAEIHLQRGDGIVKRYASEHEAVSFADQHAWMKGQTYVDPYHFSPKSCRYQALQMATLISSCGVALPHDGIKNRKGTEC